MVWVAVGPGGSAAADSSRWMGTNPSHWSTGEEAKMEMWGGGERNSCFPCSTTSPKEDNSCPEEEQEAMAVRREEGNSSSRCT